MHVSESKGEEEMRCISCGKRLFTKKNSYVRGETSIGYLCPCCYHAYTIGYRDARDSMIKGNDAVEPVYDKVMEKLNSIERSVSDTSAYLRVIRRV